MRLLESRHAFENALFRLREDRLELPGGRQIRYAYEERADSVLIVPVTEPGEVVLIRQFRYPVDEWCWEVPAGGMHDAQGLSLEELARKELREELGAQAGPLEEICELFTAPAFTDERTHVFMAWQTALTEPPEREPAERIESRPVPIGEALEMARSGRMKNAPCALALLLCESRLRAYCQADRP